MRKNKQLVVDKVLGDCFRACLTSMLDIPNDPNLPTGGEDGWFIKWYKILGEFGLFLRYDEKACWSHGYWIASVKSLNSPGECTHAIIMEDSEVWHDPSTAKQYTVGESLLGKDVVIGGFSLQVIDPSFLHKLVEYQQAHK